MNKEEESPIDQADINIMFEAFADCKYNPDIVKEIAEEFYCKYQCSLLSNEEWKKLPKPVYPETKIVVTYRSVDSIKNGNIEIYRETIDEKKYGPLIKISRNILIVFGLYKDNVKSGETWYFDNKGQLDTHDMFDTISEHHHIQTSMDGKRSVKFGGYWTGDGWTD